MDSRLEEKLTKIEGHIKELRRIEGRYFELEATEKPMLAKITLSEAGKSHAEKVNKALASEQWQVFSEGLVIAHADYLQSKRRYELLLKAFDAEYLTMKTEASAIRRQI